MRRMILATLIAFAVAPVSAQQQPTPSQLAIQIDSAVNGMAQTIEALQAALAASQARVKELEEKAAKDSPK